MGYFKQLDEYSTEELLVEIDRRVIEEVDGNCAYCKRLLTAHTCKFARNMDAYHNTTKVRHWIEETSNAIEGIGQ